MEQLIRLEHEIQALRSETDRRHGENMRDSEINRRQNEMMLQRLDVIVASVSQTNQRVSVLEEAVDTLKSEWQIIRARYHELVGKAQEALGLKPSQPLSFDQQAVSYVALRYWVASILTSFLFGTGVVMWILKLLGKV